jgi:hypothetical protein
MIGAGLSTTTARNDNESMIDHYDKTKIFET